MKERTWSRGLLGFWTWIVVAFMVLPIVIIIPFSLNSARYLSFPPDGLSLQWYARFVSDPTWVHATVQSAKVAIMTTIVALVVGTLAAFGQVRRPLKYNGFISIIVIYPMLAPHIVLAIGIFGLFAHLGLTGTTLGLVLAHSLITVPFVYINVVARLQLFDANLERAAESLGASPMVAFYKITLPNIMPALVAGGAFAFITSWDEFIITLFNADADTQTLPIRIFSGVYHGVDVTAAAAAVVVMLGLLAGGFVYWMYEKLNVKRREK